MTLAHKMHGKHMLLHESIYGRTGDLTQGLPHAKRVWYHYTTCPITSQRKYVKLTSDRHNQTPQPTSRIPREEKRKLARRLKERDRGRGKKWESDADYKCNMDLTDSMEWEVQNETQRTWRQRHSVEFIIPSRNWHACTLWANVSCGVRTHAQLPAVDLKYTPLATRANWHCMAWMRMTTVSIEGIPEWVGDTDNS